MLTLNFSLDATSSAILCFSAETGPKKKNKAIEYMNIMHWKDVYR